MIGIIVPAHKEEEQIELCAQSLLKAAASGTESIYVDIVDS